MTCSYCGSRNSELEHRCRRCGRKPGDVLNGDFALYRTTGALAAEVRQVPRIQPSKPRSPVATLARPVQGSLFSNVIPIEAYAPPQARPAPLAKPKARPRSTTSAGVSRPPVRRAPYAPEGQGKLDFLPPVPAGPRTLGTTVEAVIYCEAPVAGGFHRAVAAALDWAMVLIAYGLFLFTFHLRGGAIVLNQHTLPIFGAAFLLVGFTYGIFWAVAGTETAGMRWTQLRLITFDGFPLDRRQHLLRLAGACLSRCTLLGLLWSLFDEEGLAWQDHISRTFATPQELEMSVFRRR